MFYTLLLEVLNFHSILKLNLYRAYSLKYIHKALWSLGKNKNWIRTIVNFLCSVLHNTYTFFMDFDIENIPSFRLRTFHLIYLAQDSSKLCSVLHYTFTFIIDFNIENISSFMLHTYYII